MEHRSLRTVHLIMCLEHLQEGNLVCSVYLTTELFFSPFLECLLGLEYGEQPLKGNADLISSSILLLKNSTWKTGIDKKSLLHHCKLSVLPPVIINHLPLEVVWEGVCLFCGAMENWGHSLIFCMFDSLLFPHLSLWSLPVPKRQPFHCA